MSLTPIFDAVLADSEPDLFLASSIFPRPTMFPRHYWDEELDSPAWALTDLRYKSKVLGVWSETVNAA